MIWLAVLEINPSMVLYLSPPLAKTVSGTKGPGVALPLPADDPGAFGGDACPFYSSDHPAGIGPGSVASNPGGSSV